MTHTILVVEDEADLLLMLRVSLEVAGYRVIGVASGEEAIDVLQRETPDAIILDLLLPGIDGWEVLERLRDAGHFPRIPVVVASAHASPETKQRAMSLGCRGYLSKPLSIEALRTMLADLVADGGKPDDA